MGIMHVMNTHANRLTAARLFGELLPIIIEIAHTHGLPTPDDVGLCHVAWWNKLEQQGPSDIHIGLVRDKSGRPASLSFYAGGKKNKEVDNPEPNNIKVVADEFFCAVKSSETTNDQ